MTKRFREAVKTGMRNPSDIFTRRGRNYIGRKANQIFHSRGNVRKYNPNGIDIFSEDWDNLVVLDACRYDYFKQKKIKHNLRGELEHRISRGSQTPEWLWANFSGKELFETVYISASAQPWSLGVDNSGGRYNERYGFDLKVHDLINVWNWENPPEGATNRLKESATGFHIPADVMATESLKLADKYPNKKLVIHIVEPHTPYYGTEKGKEIYNISKKPWRDKIQNNTRGKQISIKELRTAYEQNVNMAVKAADTLLRGLKGKTVISADHGEMLWEQSSPFPIVDVLHPNRTYVEELVKVPWLVSDGERKEITAEPPKQRQIDKETRQTAKEQLEALGYRDNI